MGKNSNLYIATMTGWIMLIVESFFGPPAATIKEKIIETVFKYTLWIQFFFIALKLEGAMIPWTFTLFIVLTVSLMSIMFGIVIFVVFLSTLCGKSSNNRMNSLVFGTGLYSLTALSNVLWGFVVLYLEKRLSTIESVGALSDSLFFGILLSSSMIIYFRVYKKSLLVFFQYEAFNSLDESEEQTDSVTQTRFQINNLKQKLFLVKINSTYFSTLQKSFRLRYKEIKEKLNLIKQRKLKNSDYIQEIKENCSKSYKIKRSRSFENTFQDLDPLFDNQKINFSFDDVEKLEKADRFLECEQEDKESCFVCECDEADAVIMNCGHGGICYECALIGWEKSKKCYICRRDIGSVLKVKNLPKLNMARVINKTENLCGRQDV